MTSRFLFIFVFCFHLLAPPAGVAAPSGQAGPLPAPDGQRFLFVVDVSSGMEKLAAENESTLYDLILTGLYGQMRTGDTYGLWTFNKETSAGQFPMQVWDMRRHNQIATIAAAFLGERTYEKSSDPAQMIRNLARVIQAVSNLNVFIISDGRETISGTPFDKSINAEYKRQRKERSQAKRPFVTTLVARDGLIGNYSVTIAGQPILLPERPAPSVTSRKLVTPPVAQGAQLSNTVGQTAGTGAAVVTKQPQPVVPASAIPPAPEKIVQPSDTTVSAQKSASPTNVIASAESSVQPVHRQVAIETITKANDVTASPKSIAAQGKTETATPAVAPANDALNNPSAPPPNQSAATARVNGPTSASSSVESSAPRGFLESIFPDPIPVAARELPPAPPEPELPARSAATPAVQAAALPVHPTSNSGVFLALGGLLAAIALFLLFVVLRRMRPAPGSSLITQSMERR